MACNIVEVIIVSLKICESLLFSNLFHKTTLSVLLEDKQKSKSGGVDIPWILPTFTHGIQVF